MRLVRPLLAVEIGFGIAPATGRRLVRSVPGGLKLFNEAHASISVPSTVKCSVDRRGRLGDGSRARLRKQDEDVE